MLSHTVIFQSLKAIQPLCAFSNSCALRAPRHIKMWIDGKPVESETTNWMDLNNPATGEVIGKVPICTQNEMQRAVDSSKEAYKSWGLASPITRAECMYNFRGLLKRDMTKLAEVITREHGKPMAFAEAELKSGIQVVELACAAPSVMMGEHLFGVGTDVDVKTMRLPLGVCSTILPFNFPGMCTLWVLPLALVTGNTLIMKPSEADPSTALMFAELLKEAGLPDGCLNVIHGLHDTVNFICDNPDIKAISFIGGNQAGEHVYQRAAKTMKRVQCNMGAKCINVLMPDANKSFAIKRITSGAYAASGQQCVALTASILVGEARKWIPDIVNAAKGYKVGDGREKTSDFGPVVTMKSKMRCLDLITSAEKDGCQILLDGRNVSIPGHENGYFVGATVIGGVKEHMRCYKEEIFGPVLLLMTAETLDEAIEIVNRNQFGNGTTLFTNSGSTARRFTQCIAPGQVGVNISVPIPMPLFSFTGNKKSFAGDTNFNGKSGLNFFTQLKTVTTLWRRDDAGHDLLSENFNRK